MLKKKFLAPVAIVVTGVLSIACGLSTTAGQWIDAKSTVWILGKDKVPYRVTVELLVPTRAGGENVTVANVLPYLVVSVATCPGGTCASTTPYVIAPTAKTTTTKPTDPQYDDDDLNDVMAQVTGWGTTLNAEWKGTAPSSPVDSSTSTDNNSVGSSANWKAVATIKFLGLTCADPAATITRITQASPMGVTWPIGKALPANAVPGIPVGAKCLAAPKK
jgi:hypothetical protein